MSELKFIDISNHQGNNGFKLANHLDQIDAVICKATQGTYYVDPYCDVFIQTAIAAGKPWGFYCFADSRYDPKSTSDYFIENCKNYIGHGIPVLDWEDLCENGLQVSNPSVSWVNEFTKQFYYETGIHPWIYANPWRFNQGGVDPDCMRWIADYPNVMSPSIDYTLPDIPETDGLVGAWQFCSDGRLAGYSHDLDFNRFFGDAKAWQLYATGVKAVENPEPEQPSVETYELENDSVKVTVELK